MTDGPSATGPTVPPPSPDDEPLAGSTDVAAAGGPNAASVAWAKLDPTSQLIAGGSIAAFFVTLLGIPFGAWDSTDFILIMFVATIAAGAGAWATGTMDGKPTPIPLPPVELAGGAVAAVLAIWNLIEILFDLDDLTRGGIIGLVLTIALAVAAAAILVGALRRSGGARTILMPDDMWTRIALGGLALVLLGWALNLSVSYWTMAAATLSLAVLTLATVLIVLSRQIPSPVPAAWAGVLLGALAVLLAIDLWGKFTAFTENRVDLSIVDIGAFLIYVLGILAIIAGGVLSALDQRAAATAEVGGPPLEAPGGPPPAAS